MECLLNEGESGMGGAVADTQLGVVVGIALRHRGAPHGRFPARCECGCLAARFPRCRGGVSVERSVKAWTPEVSGAPAHRLPGGGPVHCCLVPAGVAARGAFVLHGPAVALTSLVRVQFVVGHGSSLSVGEVFEKVRDERVDARLVVDDVDFSPVAPQLGVHALLQLPHPAARALDLDEHNAAQGNDDPVGHSPASRRDELQTQEAVCPALSKEIVLDETLTRGHHRLSVFSSEEAVGAPYFSSPGSTSRKPVECLCIRETLMVECFVP